MKILKAIAIIVLFLAIYQIAQLFIMLGFGVVHMIGQFMALAASGLQPDLDKVILEITSYLAAQTPWVLLLAVAITVPTYYLFYRERRQELFTFVSVRSIRPLSVPVLVLFGCSLSYMLAIILTLLSQIDIFSKVFNNYEQMSEMIFGGSFVLTLLSVGIIGPIFEEILFRGLVFGELRKITKVKVALVLQALLFGIYHLNVVQGVYAFILGLIIGFVYYRSNSIIAPIIIHVSINSLSVIIDEFFSAGQMESWGLVITVASLALFVLTGTFILASKSFKHGMDDSLYWNNRPVRVSGTGGGPEAGSGPDREGY